MSAIATAAVACTAACLAGAGVWGVSVVRRKYRLVWREIFGLKAAIGQLEKQLVVARKELILATTGEFRLPAALPSQNGEEILLWNFFRRKRQGFYVDVGAHNGRDLSNTYFLESIGWRGVLLEPNPRLYKEMISRRPNSSCVLAAVGDRTERKTVILNCVSGQGGLDTLSYTVEGEPHKRRVAESGGRIERIEVPNTTLAAVLANVREPIDFISIDVEGAELEVLRGLDYDRHAPRVFLVEDNTRGEDRTLVEFLMARGYVERIRLGENVFFTRHDDPDAFTWEVEVASSREQ